jgi:hypothetical protein
MSRICFIREGRWSSIQVRSTHLTLKLVFDRFELANGLDASLADIVLLGDLTNGSLALAQFTIDDILDVVGNGRGRSE